MTETVTLVAVSASLRDWLRSHTSLDALIGDRVYVGGLPTGTTLSSIVLRRVGGLTDGPIDRPLIQFDVRHPTSGASAEAIAAALLTLLLSTNAGTVIVAGLLFMGANAETAPIWLPDPEADTPRYVLTVEIAVKHLP